MPATDVELVRGALDGSESAFRDIVLRYQRPVFGIIVRVVRDQARAEELAQDTFVKAFRALHTFDLARRFSAWLFTIAHRVAIDEARRSAPETVSLDELEDDGNPVVQIADAKGATPAVILERAELASALDAAIARLRPAYRELVSLKYEQGLDYEEIMEITGLPGGTVKSSLHRARKELAGQLLGLGWRK